MTCTQQTQADSSGGERPDYTGEVAGSSPAPPTNYTATDKLWCNSFMKPSATTHTAPCGANTYRPDSKQPSFLRLEDAHASEAQVEGPERESTTMRFQSAFDRRSCRSVAWRQVLLLVTTVSILLPLLVGCSRDPKVKAANHFAKAEKYLQKNNSEAAIIELRTALQFNPKLAKAHFALANLELRKGAVQTAFYEYVATARIEPQNHEAQVMVGELLARAKNFSEAKGQAQLILSKWPDDKVGTLLLVESYFGLQDYQQGKELLNWVLAEDPNNGRALSDLAFLQLVEKKGPEAESTLRKAWQLDPRNATTAAVLGTIYQAKGDKQMAESFLKDAQQRNQDLVPFNALLATFYMSQRRFAEAEPLVRHIQEIATDQPEYRTSLAEFYLATSRPRDAEAEYKRLLASNGKDWQSWRGLAKAYVADGRYDDANDALNHLLKNNAKDWEALAVKGRMLLDQGHTSEAVTDLQKSKKANPESLGTTFDLARAYISAGELQEAQSELHDILKTNPSYPGAANLLASLELSSGHVDQAIQDLNEEAASKPWEVGTQLLLSQAYIAKGDWRTAELNLSHIQSDANSPATKGVILQTQASIKLGQKQYAEAARLADQALDERQKSTVALSVLGTSYLLQKQPDQGILALQARLAKTPDWAEGYQVLARMAQQAGRFNIAVDAFNKALSIQPESTDATLGLADTYFMMQQFDRAFPEYEKAAQQVTARSYAQLRLGQIYEGKGDFVKARACYEKSLAANPENVTAKNNLAWIYAEHGGNIDVALKLAEEAKEKAPNDPNIADTLGWIYVKKGSYEAAVQSLRDSVAKEPNNASYLYHLGTAYYKLGRPSEARRELEAAVKVPNSGNASDAKRMLAELTAK